jgi:5-methylcytosine-specific restriction endonuclease McrBC GTP-binding regulatory subunit McrB
MLYQELKNEKNMKEKIDLLKNNKNLILTGAPGTGKTYWAKQIAMQMIGVKTEEELGKSEQYDFVQFHPSYDYTDFVEGLRPTPPDDKGHIGFERKDGVFKDFCKKASESSFSANNFDKQYDQFINDLTEGNISFKTTTKGNDINYKISANKSFIIITEKAQMSVTKERIKNYVENDEITDWKSYVKPIGEYFKEKYPVEKSVSKNIGLPFIFIIDEINRGEISKIFGELFFSIDPGYRGMKGAVKTQYANMHDNPDEKFYIPENVYIIGTMNDIDRSVESFDFAMRRRFTWVEITAEESAENMNLPEESKQRMKSLNQAISAIEGLNSSYHVGGAYFLKKDSTAETDFDDLWKLRLKPLLFEYLRGMPDADKKLDDLKKAYENN